MPTIAVHQRDGYNTPAVSYTRGTDLSGSMEGAGGIGGLLARSVYDGSGGWTNHAYYRADGNGNITYMVNTSEAMVASYRYDPFGNLISSSGSLASANLYRFSSKLFHTQSGMYYFGFRFYVPSLQRWVNCDPFADPASRSVSAMATAPEAESDGAGDTSDEEFADAWARANGNLYRALGNSPIGSFDPFGLCDDSLDATARSNPGELGRLAREAAERGWNLNGRGNGLNVPKEFHKGFPKWHRDYNDLAKAMLDKAERLNPEMTAEEAAHAVQQIADKLLRYTQACMKQAGY